MTTRVTALLATLSVGVFAQGISRDAGHCVAASTSVLACWNEAAGRQMGESIGTYPEFLPNLRGWDFRINLPHVRFQTLRAGGATPTTMAGVIEDPGPIYQQSSTLPITTPISGQLIVVPPYVDYGHRDNAIWLFRPDAATGTISFAVLPSRRNRPAGLVENATSLTNAWFRVGPTGGPHFSADRVAVAVVGRGLDATAIHVVARDTSSRLHHTQLAVNTTHITQWPTAWRNLNITAASPPSLIATGSAGVALAWTDADGRVMVQQRAAAQNNWSQPVVAGTGADPHAPRLVTDAATLNVFYTTERRLEHVYRTDDSPLMFSPPTVVPSPWPVRQEQFDVMFFNGALHAAIGTIPAKPVNGSVFYTTTTTPLGRPSAWTSPSATTLLAGDAPRIAHLYENVFVIARNAAGRVAYARKDPNRVDNRIAGNASSDRWLSAGTDIDPATTGDFSQLEVLSFNSDLYLTAHRIAASFSAGTIVNFGRAAFKQLLQSKWGMALTYAEEAGPLDSEAFGDPNEIRMAGNFNGDRMTDVIRFPQTQVAGVGPAPVYVRTQRGIPGAGVLFTAEAPWHTFFSLKGEIPKVGDFDGDDKDDIVTFTQREQKFANGTVIGPAPVWVSLSTGIAFGGSRIWHTFFSLAGEVPLVGDFNGDGKDDIVTFTQREQKFANGTVIGPAPVWVSLSTGWTFGRSRIWHTGFSPQGEVPMTGDFDGDGKTDIVSFARRQQKNPNGTVIGNAPVRVALSNGTTFGESRVWHTFFSLDGELPLVADVNMDGKDDIVTFLHGTGGGAPRNNVYVAFSTGTRFETSVTWMSNQAAPGQTPFVGWAGTGTLADLTGRSEDAARRLADLFVFDDATGRLRLAQAMGRIPYALGAPWERYRYFVNKGVGAAQFPEWLYEKGPAPCLVSPFRFILNGAAGAGAPDYMISSVRPGGGAGHILEEMGHSMFANCLRANKDPFQLFNSIYNTPMASGGLEASQMPGCDGSFDDCRDPEHFFLQLIKKYRLAGDEFRHRILHGTGQGERARRLKQYLWLKEHWYDGAAFKLGALEDVSLYPEGVLCLPGECSVTGPVISPGSR